MVEGLLGLCAAAEQCGVPTGAAPAGDGEADVGEDDLVPQPGQFMALQEAAVHDQDRVGRGGTGGSSMAWSLARSMMRLR